MTYRLKITHEQAIRIATRLVIATGKPRNVWTRGARSYISTDIKPQSYDHVEISLA